MKNTVRLSAASIAVAVASLLPNQVLAAPDSAELQAQIAEMRAQVEAMQSRIVALEAEVEAAHREDDAAPAASAATIASAPPVAAAAPVAAPSAPKETTKITWKGAPQFSTSDGWSFKLGGRLNMDAGVTDYPDSLGLEDGVGSELRRARLRVQGTVPGGFGYKFETDFAASDVTITDAYMNYESKFQNGGSLEIIAGQHNTFQGLEELSSSLNTSFIERAAFTDAFEFERRLGLSAAYTKGAWLMQGGVFTDNIEDLSNRNYSVDGRLVYMPRFDGVQLHLGGSLHYAKLTGDFTEVRYRQRPFEHYSSERFINTGTFEGESERGIGLESAVIAGPFHATGETYWQRVSRPGLADPTFFGGAFELGYFLTKGDTRGYKAGVFDHVKPAHPLGQGGIGAIQVNARYDYLDLTDAGIVGGTQNGYELSLIWTQTEWTRLMLNYAHLEYDDAAYATASGDRSYGVNVIAVRGQVSF